MAASPVLVDSSYYITLMREGVDPVKRLTYAAASRDLAICGVVRCEVGRGIRAPRVREKIGAFWDVMLNVPTDNRLWSEAENAAWSLDRKGITLPLSDIVIACCAKRIGAVVLTFDHHFHEVPDLRVINEFES